MATYNMIKSDASEFRWELIGIHKDTDKTVRVDCPAEAVGKIIEEIIMVSQGESSQPSETIRERLKSLLDKKIIAIELVHKLTKIDIDWIERFIQGKEVERISTKSYFPLLKLIEDLRE